MIQFTVKPANGHKLSYPQRVYDERCPIEIDQAQQKLPTLEENRNTKAESNTSDDSQS